MEDDLTGDMSGLRLSSRLERKVTSIFRGEDEFGMDMKLTMFGMDMTLTAIT